MQYIGCHLSSSKGFAAMGKTALSIGANTFQFFTRNPRGGAAKDIDPQDAQALVLMQGSGEIGKIVAHAPYTLNPCAKEEKTLEFARNTMQDDLRRMEFVPGNFYNFHPGSHVGQGTEEGIRKIAETLDLAMFEGQTTIVLLETMAGKGTEVGGRFEELRAIIDRTAMQEKLGVCLDTCHVSDAGYDIAGHLDAVLEEFDRVIGLPRLRALHLNDSKNPLASHKDRHERLGEGYLGIETFYRIIEHPALRGLPMILETPNELPGYAAEIARLRAYDAANANKL
ncbi:MAG TPA: endonuclease IV [Clostridiales bacterium]|nr:endonuclease IV [Clostridiales bacterium]